MKKKTQHKPINSLFRFYSLSLKIESKRKEKKNIITYVFHWNKMGIRHRQNNSDELSRMKSNDWQTYVIRLCRFYKPVPPENKQSDKEKIKR